MFTKQIILIASALVAYSTASCLHGTSLLRREETPGGKVKVANFGYTGLQGPLNWAGLAPENKACSTGKVQSPINIDDKIRTAAETPVIKFPDVESAEFENLGTTLEVIVNGTTQFAGKEFKLKQFHFHTPSEHRIAEEYFPLEMHMVHEAADGSGGIAVLAVTFQLSEDGTTTELLTAVTKNIAQVITPGTVTETGPLKFAPLANHLQTKPLFQYTGSLTTPPCAEGLTFLVTKEPLPLDVKTFNAVKKVIKFNSRYTQNALNEKNLVELAVGNLGGDGGDGGKPPVQSPGVPGNGTVPGGVPTKTETAATTPVVTEPAVTEPVATKPPVTEPNPVVTEPTVTTPGPNVTAPPEVVDKLTTSFSSTSKTPTETKAPQTGDEQHCVFGACSGKGKQA